jgi:hypothetical protein
MGPVSLIIYPSEDFNFVNLVQLSDLILDLLCIHLNILVMVDMVTIYHQHPLSILFLVPGPRATLRRSVSFRSSLTLTLTLPNLLRRGNLLRLEQIRRGY